MKESTSFGIIADHLPRELRQRVMGLRKCDADKLTEIRLYSGRPVALVYPEKVMYLTDSGVSASFNRSDVVTVSFREISGIVESLAHFSLHSAGKQLREGFFTLKGGIRVGLSGTVNDSGSFTEVTGLNFRVARAVTGCAGRLFELIHREPAGILICGGVNSGKTTVLRDLCRQVGNYHKSVLVDDRNEIAFSQCGTVGNDVGMLTDVLTGCTREWGIITAIRTLSPEFIICDELSSEKDVAAVLKGVGCGVNFVATAHGRNREDIEKRRDLRQLFDSGAFEYIVFLYGADKPGEIREIRRIGNGT